MKRSRKAYLIAGGLLIGVIFFVMIFAQQLTAVSPDYWDAKQSVLLGLPPFPPGPEHPLGTDQYGRDIWSRIAYGSRWSMLFAFLIMSARLALATPAALLSVFGPKRIGWLVDRLYVMTSAIPPLLIYILILSVPHLRVIGLWPSVIVTVTLLTLMEWPRVAVVLKGRLSSLLAEPFVEGAMAVGNTQWQIFKNHLFPHLWPVLLHLLAAEMARALVVIAQLAIFGIMVGGGVINIIMDSRGNDVYVATSGIPEWGTLLGDGRYDIRSNPWIPFSPAVAFLVGVVGFNLLSQGLEAVVFSIQEIKEATTARLSRRWRWALLAVPAAAILWYYQGLPWDRAAGIADLAARQAAALTDSNPDAFTATLRTADFGVVEDLRRWAAESTTSDVEAVTVEVEHLSLKGARATVTWYIHISNRTGANAGFLRQTRLVRHLGRWYEAGPDFTPVRGFHADVTAVWDPIDPRVQAIPMRWNVQLVATAADHAFESVLPYFPATAGAPRPQLVLYPDIGAFRQAVGPRVPDDATVWYEPGEPIRLAPEFLKGFKRWDVERSLAFEMMKFLTETRLGGAYINPLTLGDWELHLEKEMSSYRIDADRLVGQPLFELESLFRPSAADLSQKRQFLYATQAALLTEYVEAKLPERPVAAASAGALAERLGTTVEALSRDYRDYVLERILSESAVRIPAARARIPAGLAEAVAARGRALAAGEAARQQGLTEYEATLLQVAFPDYREQSDIVSVTVLEKATFADGRVISGVVNQVWTKLNAGWVTRSADSGPSSTNKG
ncbi:MAG TPA: ABC transporter permease subunit [Symbiobacteriaceae bacterium]|nr:ABC transporter permease subunit [Symbiobacteriaceae bacterium]